MLIIALAATIATTTIYRKQKGERFKFVTSPTTVCICIDLVGFQERHSLTLACREALVDGNRGLP